MNSPLQAEECLKTVLCLEKKIKEDHYLIPYSMVELGLIVNEQGDKQRAIQILEDAKYVQRILNFNQNFLTVWYKGFTVTP